MSGTDHCLWSARSVVCAVCGVRGSGKTIHATELQQKLRVAHEILKTGGDVF